MKINSGMAAPEPNTRDDGSMEEENTEDTDEREWGESAEEFNVQPLLVISLPR